MLPVEATALPTVLSGAATRRRILTLRRGIALALFASGFSSLICQVTWQRVLTQTIGVDAVSMAIIVTVFLAGLGLGAQVGARFCALHPNRLLSTYILIESAIGLFALVAVPVLRTANRWSGTLLPESFLIDFLVNAAVLLSPTLLMGITAPLAIEIVSARRRDVCTSIGLFYGINTIGAALGALVAGFILIELLGLTATARLAGFIHLTAALIIAATGRIPRDSTPNPTAPLQAAPDASQSLSARVLFACLAFGFVTLGYEMILFRVMSFHFESHVYVFPLVLGAVLAAMGTGDAVAGFLADRAGSRRAPQLLLLTLALTALATVAVFHLPAPSVSHGVFRQWPAMLFVVAAVVPIAIHAGFFPATARMVAGVDEAPGRIVGGMLFWYTAGNVLGCFITAFVLLPNLGTMGTTAICLLVTVFGAAGLLRQNTSSHVRRWAAPAAVVLIVAMCTLLPSQYYETARRLTEVREGPEGVVSYRDGAVLGGIQVNGTPAAQVYRTASTLVRSEHDLSLLAQVDPGFRPQSVLIVGLGSANFPWALRDHPTIQRIRVVELSPRVVEFVRKYSDDEIAAALDDPRVETIIGDGRRHLERAAARGESFDVIQIGTFYPDVAGSANLYSRDLMETARKCLRPGGYFMTLDCAGIAKTGLSVFRNGMMIEEMPHYMFFFDHPWPRMHEHEFAADSPPASSETIRIRRLDVDRFARHEINSDDRPWLEFRLLRYLSGQAPNLRARLHRIDPALTGTLTVLKAPDSPPAPPHHSIP